MFSNMKIKYKMAFGFLIVIAIGAVIAIYTLNNIRRIDRDYTQLMNTNERVYIILQIPTDIADLRRLITTVAFRTGQLEFLPNLERDINQVHASYISRINDFRASVASDSQLSPEAREHYFGQMDELERLVNYYISDIVVPTLAAAHINDIDTVLSFGVAGVPVVAAMTEIYAAIIEDSMSHVRDTHVLLNTQAVNARNISLAMCFIGLAIAIIVSISITLSVSRPINKITNVLKDVSAGKLNTNIDRANISKNEIGVLTQGVCVLADVIRDIVDDLNVAYEIYMVQGDSKYQINTDKYQNAFKEVIQKTNDTYEEVTFTIMNAVDALNQISVGNFDVNVHEEGMDGDWAAQPQAIHAVIANLKGVSTEINAMTEAAAVKGDLDFKTDAEKYSGDWKKIMEGLNQVAEAVDTPLKVIYLSLEEMKQGNFNLSDIDNKIAASGLDANVENYGGMFGEIMRFFNVTLEATESYISELERVLARMAEGDLRNKIEREYVGSFDLIKRSVNNINSKLNKTMSEISVAAEQVLSGANQISTSANDLASGAQEQASSVQELNATIDIINQQTRQKAENASTANELSAKSALNAREGNDAMKQTVDAMSQIKESSDSISKIIKTIQDIAFQTNLLALNASVEAARAAEHGKGFAVVADEVRTLAGRSQDAANETTMLIQDSISRVESGSAIAETTSESLDSIVASAGEVSKIVDGIYAASTEQAEAIGQISDGLEQISRVTQSNSAVSEETAASAEELNSQVEVLKQLVSYFKL
ncbi:MAG: methyl-accepting chemotaxis protein [Defluviitaleaceae bacterium]|nr:methyl-accepting chemotaxis protein [Defluviitaleaceae bacterium]